MVIYDFILVVMRATLLFLAGFACLRLVRRSTPAVRHLICLTAIGGSLAALLTIFLPQPVITIYTLAAAGSQAPAIADPAKLSLTGIAVLVWACGCLAVLFRLLLGWRTLARIRRTASRPAGENDVRIFAADVNVPLVTGLLNPVILMPRAAPQWPKSQYDAAIRHEMAHLERRDLPANFVAWIACSIYWFHPLVWLLVSRMRVEQEAACDDAVLQTGFDCTTYAEALIGTARAANGYLPASCPMSGSTKVKERIIRVLSFAPEAGAPVTARRTSRIAFAGLVAVAVVSSVGCQHVYVYTRAEVSDAPSVAQQVQPQYTKAARDAKIQGEVILTLVVGPDGIARDIVVVQGLESGLDRSAVEALRQWRFKPAIRNGVPVAMKAKVQIHFHLV